VKQTKGKAKGKPSELELQVLSILWEHGPLPGMANIYRPLVSQKQAVNPVMKDLLRNIFGGDASAVVQCLLDSSNPDADELKEIRRLINQAAKEKK